MARRSQPIPGEDTTHDALEGLLDIVWKQEKAWRLYDRIDAQVTADERRARAKTSPTQGSTSKPAATPRAKPRPRHRRSDPGLRHPRARKKDEPDPRVRSGIPASVIVIGLFALSLSVAGIIFAAAVKLVRILV